MVFEEVPEREEDLLEVDRDFEPEDILFEVVPLEELPDFCDFIEVLLLPEI